MRSLKKLEAPQILELNHELWLEEFHADRNNKNSRYRYRHRDIKNSLKLETFGKCLYCESYIGHNTPGDIEHKIPTSKEPDLHFTWSNLTIACTECNRRKNDYYDVGNSFIDPYHDPVEEWLDHDGPAVFWRPPNAHMETCVSLLELNSDKRPELIIRKTAKLNEVMSLLERIASETDPVLRHVLELRLKDMCGPRGEYSMCVSSFVKAKGFGELLHDQ